MPEQITKSKSVELRKSLQTAVLDSYSEKYKELSEIWRNLETKAQGTITIAGIFIAGALAYIREISPQTYLYEKLFLGISIVCLIICVIYSILALYIRDVSGSPIGKILDDLAQKFFKVKNDKDFQAYIEKFPVNQCAAWRKTEESVCKEIKLKADHLLKAHIFLVLAVLIIALLSILKLFFIVEVKK